MKTYSKSTIREENFSITVYFESGEPVSSEVETPDKGQLKIKDGIEGIEQLRDLLSYVISIYKKPCGD